MRVAIAGAACCFAIACVKPDPYACAADADCRAGGVDGFCEADGLCSIADSACGSGRRYGDSAGDVAGECVGGNPPVAAGRHCLPGVALPIEDACAGLVCATRPWCCDDAWSEHCVHAAETVCELPCSGALAGAGYTFAGAGSFDGMTYTSEWTGPASGWVYGVAWGDHDGDGHADLAIAREQQQAGVVIYPWNPSGSPLLGDPLAIGGDEIGTVWALEWIDHGHDGILDLLASGSGGLYLIRQDAGGAFSALRLSPLGVDGVTWIDDDAAAPWRLAVTYSYIDNPDPDPDVPAHVTIHQLDGEPPMLDPGVDLGVEYVGDIAYCQVSGGPGRDLVVGSYPAFVAVASASGFDAPAQLSVGGYRVECADMDNDGDDDVIIGGGNSDPVDLLRNQAGITDAEDISAFLPSDGLDVGDVDGDHDLDIVTSTANELTSPLTFLRNDGKDFNRSSADDWNGPDWTASWLDLGPR